MKIAKHKNVPDLRFPGFADDWEQRKLGEVSKFRQGTQVDLDKQYTDITDGRERFIRIVDYTQGTEDIRYIDEIENANHVDEDDVVVVRYGATAGFVGRGIIGIIANNMFTITPLDCVNKKFLYTFMKQEKMYENLNSSNGSSAMPAINFGIMNNIDISYPSIKEQEKIGHYFDNLDNLITLHQRKCDEVKELKKAMLQKMFPKEGEKVPEIRFPGFADDWERCKVTKLGEIYIGLVTTMTSHYTNHGALLIRNSDIKDSRFEFGDNPIYLDDEFAKHNASRKHKVGDVITVHTGDIGTSAVITEKEAGSIGFATIVTRPNKEKITPEYLCVYLNTDTHKNFAMSISTGDGRNNYNLKDYYECVVPVPSTVEQRRISGFIGVINNLIAFHQRKCDEMKKLKQAMLQKMFV